MCQQTKSRTVKQPGSVDHFPIPSDVFSSVSIDFVDLPLTEHNTIKYDYCMVVVCRLSGYVLAIPTTKRWLDGRKAAELLLGACCSFYGTPSAHLCGQTEYHHFKFYHTICSLSGIQQHQSVIFLPFIKWQGEGSGQVMMALRKLLHRRADKWVQALPLAVWSLNDLPGLKAPLFPPPFGFWEGSSGVWRRPPFCP